MLLDYREFYSLSLGLSLPPTRSKSRTPLPCPLHNDTRPSAILYHHTGVFHCSVCGSFSAVQFTARTQGIPVEQARLIVHDWCDSQGHYEAISEIEQQISYSKLPYPRLVFAEILEDANETDPWTRDILQHYCSERGIDPELLKEEGVGVLPGKQTPWRRESIVIPQHYGGKIVALRLRDREGGKIFAEGSCRWLYGVDTITSDTRTVVLVEGESDRLRLLSELRKAGVYDVPVVSVPGVQWNPLWTRDFSGVGAVLLIRQSDSASDQLEKTAGEALGTRMMVMNLDWHRGQVGKDLCEWFAYNTVEPILDMLRMASEHADRRFLLCREWVSRVSRPAEYIIEGLLAAGELGIMGGPQKSLKTWLALEIIRAILEPGTPLLGIRGLCATNDRKVLLIEEEDTDFLFKQRLELMFGHIPDWQDRVVIGHRLGVQLDTIYWQEYIQDTIATHKIGFIVGDPLQDLHQQDEDKVGEMQKVLRPLRKCQSLFPGLGVLLLHHFTKTGTIHDEWKAFRGTSGLAGASDLGIFVEALQAGEIQAPHRRGLKFLLDGRTLNLSWYNRGDPPLKVMLDETLADRYEMVCVNGPALDLLIDELIREVSARAAWHIADAKQHFGLKEPDLLYLVKKVPEIKFVDGRNGTPPHLRLASIRRRKGKVVRSP